MVAWDEYQETAAEFFRSIGMEAETNETVQGTRTAHDIDVVVRSRHVGFDLLWLVECKLWKTAVSKLHVLALREIVSDTGADRGILISESGFQSGATEAAQLTNVQLTSMSQLKNSASYEIGMAQLREMQLRVSKCRVRYWDIDKAVRIDCGLRPEVGMGGYSSMAVMESVEFALNSAFRGEFPVNYDDLGMVRWIRYRFVANAPIELVGKVSPLISELERLLDYAESRSAQA